MRLHGLIVLLPIAMLPTVSSPAWAQQPNTQTARTGTQPQSARPAVAGRAPSWHPLPAEHQKYLDQILAYWEHTTDKTQRYRCQFKRWEYDAGSRDPNTYSEGTLQYAAPDKGLFRVDTTSNRTPPQQPGGEAQWVRQEGGFREHWICDGTSIFEFDHQNKQVKQRQLPPEMQGQRITDGPLPFLFGATAKQIKERLWLHVITPANAEAEFWLEGIPKNQADSANFAKIHIILDEGDFLPKGMVLFHRDRSQTTFAFEQREVNWSLLPHLINPFLKQFFEPKTPNGWQRVVEPIGGTPAGPPRHAQDLRRESRRR